ncbi:MULTISPECIES: hypothetical protein [unclassified Coleofasciculus]|uniref:hypothetical protein n=1 Tax=Cyanophyceae TaxID=3028117 RepID=UPI001687237C|nr:MULTISPECIES: hypothetical protein [unclassified Coleofasciculus]MBD1882269.1 hypothetical protein [Coleofasciculus sp. FACHB-T130]MBD1895055.1 hypothetical protein [Coleofasciculus sp. FACHB-129]
MSRLLYENSVSYKGYLIIPFVFGIADGQNIYSYSLLSELGHKGKFHKLENPAGIYSSCIDTIIEAAKEHLDENSDVVSQNDYFKNRYIYQDNLIIVYQLASKYFYDHYKSDNLNNVAAPKIFGTEQECITWIKEGLDKSQINQQV